MHKYVVRADIHGAENMRQVATVTSKSMVTIPSKIRKMYGLRQGSKVEFVEVEEGLFLVPLKSLREPARFGQRSTT